MKVQYIYPNQIESLQHRVYKRVIKFGVFIIREAETWDGWEFRISWSHGKNVYAIRNSISRYTLIKSDNVQKLIEEIVYDMINVRDTMIRNVTFWTNCKDVR